MSYLTSDQATSIELEEKRSRFICYLQPVTSRRDALAFLADLRSQYPTASHHCWAYLIGNPKQPQAMACSDDGEPSGTAGKPMLQVLQYRGIGDVIAVVIRYFGGVRLGAGGLVRAYSSAVQQATQQLNLITKVPYCKLQLSCNYPCEAIIRHLLESVNGRIAQQYYSDSVLLDIELPANKKADFVARLNNQAPGLFKLIEQ